MAGSSSRGRSSSPFGYRKSSSSISSSSSSSSQMNGKTIPRSCSSSSSSLYGSGNGMTTRSMTPSHGRSDSMYNDSIDHGSYALVASGSPDELIGETVDTSASGDSISVTVRFRPLSEREFQRGDEIAWYPDGDKIVRNEYNPAMAYAFDKVFGPTTTSQEVYEIAARPVIKSAMDGVNGTVFAYGVTSSGKTHTMHGDQNSPGIIPQAIKDVFRLIQDTPGREFLLRVSYLEIYNEVINDLLDPTGQNLRVREDSQGTYVEGIKEEVVLSPGHALSFIAAGEEHRHVGSNNFNLFSSRSHTIFTMMIESSARGDEYDGVIFSQLNLIDLAGSESSKTETTGLRRKEGAYINKSLLTLGTVIGKLSEGKAYHVPYRDSKLTRLLQSSLSGHGHVSLICTVTPASSNMEETHNTLKFASRAKRVEICASRNTIIDEKSLIKKYQREIMILKQELDQVKKGVLVGVSHEEIMSLKQQLELGQVKMQSRLEEEEEAKAALMSRIQRLTKLILVSTKNSIPGVLSDAPSHQRSHSLGEEDKLDTFREGSPLLIDSDNQKDSPSSALSVPSETSCDPRHKRSSSKWSEEQSAIGLTESTQAGELFSGLASGSRLPTAGMTMSDQMDLLVEQVKMLAGEIAFSTSTLKRLMEQSASDPNGMQTQIKNLEHEIQEKKRQMRVLEKRISESGEASVGNASFVDMQQTVMKLMTECSEKDFELEIRTADNRILQEQLQDKCSENKELQEKVLFLEQQLASVKDDKLPLSSDQCVSEEYVNELRKKIQSQEFENEKLKLEHVQLIEENSGLRVQNQKLAEEASYAKELASAAAVELKNLAGEVTKLSLQSARQAKELLAAEEMAYSRSSGMHTGNGVMRKHSESKNDGAKLGRKGRLTSRGNEIPGAVYNDAEYWSLDPDDIKMELQARKQREAALEAALAEKELAEEAYRKSIDEGKKREAALENDLASMWVLVAKLKREGETLLELNADERSSDGTDLVNIPKTNDTDSTDNIFKEIQVSDSTKPVHDGSELEPKPVHDSSELEPFVLRLKARMQEMKEKKLEALGHEDTNSHCASLVHLLVPSVHFVAQTFQTGSSLFLPEKA
ncbi:Kinesin [Macleaya cordata]|uniref:Kinesin n=1 Tax=Macleaya cordata TaxID=56857 RepID=A0A200Q6W8_MACCD|nr:Kinesin [Macleaya cordata]